MEITSNVFFCENDIRKIIKKHLEKDGHKLIGELQITAQALKDIPEGAIAGDVISISAKIELSKKCIKTLKAGHKK